MILSRQHVVMVSSGTGRIPSICLHLPGPHQTVWSHLIFDILSMAVSGRESSVQSLPVHSVTHQSSKTAGLKLLPSLQVLSMILIEISHIFKISSLLYRGLVIDVQLYLRLWPWYYLCAILCPMTSEISNFFFLTRALFYRALKSRLPRDAAYCLKYLYFMRNPPFEHLGINQNRILTFLVKTLTLQMELEPGNAMQCLEEMAVLCHEQLSSNLSGPELNRAVGSFAGAVMTKIADLSEPPPQQIIECLCEANARLPDSHNVSITLSRSLLLRFLLTHSNEDYEGAMAPLERIITSYSPAEIPNQSLTDALAAAARLAHCRFPFV